MTKKEIQIQWLLNKEFIEIDKLTFVSRVEKDTPWYLEPEDRIYRTEYHWCLCPYDKEHLAYSKLIMPTCDKEGYSAYWSDILNCNICDKQWIVVNNIKERIRGEEQRFFAQLLKYVEKFCKYTKEQLTGEELCQIKHTYGVDVDIVSSITDIKFSEQTIADFEKAWKKHCLKGKS